jgi:hypothetical protein
MISYDKVLNLPEIKFLRDLRDKCERREKLHGVVNWKLPKKEIEWVLKKVGIEGIITGGNYWQSPNPFHVHTDTGMQEELKGIKPKYNIVIPLNVHPTFNTVIFDQKWYGDAVHFWVGSIYKYFPDPVYNKRKDNYAYVHDMSNTNLDLVEYANLLSHLPYETVRELSINTVIPWEIGQAIVFDSQYLHCSSNFSGTKEGLTILVGEDA